LLDTQQPDGGWAYTAANSSWTEPTCFSIMALRTAVGPPTAIGHACEWLTRRQRPDGGWPPSPFVERSTHVTSLAVLALTGLPAYQTSVDRGVQWLLAQAGAEISIWARMARIFTGTRTPPADHAGWPWYPGEAPWVIPTSLAICAFSRQRNGRYSRDIERRLGAAREFLLSRRCPDHGWNHGGLFKPDEAPPSYPETTGVALLALHGINVDIEPSLRCAEQQIRNPKSSEGRHWLQLGLRAHHRDPLPAPGRDRHWTVTQLALSIIAQVTEEGRNPFVYHA